MIIESAPCVYAFRWAMDVTYFVKNIHQITLSYAIWPFLLLSEFGTESWTDPDTASYQCNFLENQSKLKHPWLKKVRYPTRLHVQQSLRMIMKWRTRHAQQKHSKRFKKSCRKCNNSILLQDIYPWRHNCGCEGAFHTFWSWSWDQSLQMVCNYL